MSKQAVISVKQNDVEKLRSTIQRLLKNGLERKELGLRLTSLFPRNANQTYIDLINKYSSKKLNKPAAFLVGIGGIGISSLAYHFQKLGYRVFGSDISDGEITRRLADDGIQIFQKHNKANLPESTTILIYSSAVPLNNEEIIEARRRHIAVYSYNEYLGVLCKQFKHVVAITGTHGKTTTTAMTGLSLVDGNIDPTIIVGSLIPQLGYRNYRKGRSNIMVLEACEYRSHMLLLDPTIIVMTNIDDDHLDYYRDIDEIKEHFQRFADKLPPDGLLIKNYDDENLRSISFPRVVTFGMDQQADYYASHIVTKNGMQSFDVYHNDAFFDHFTLKLPGRFNVLNALASIAAADFFKIDKQRIRNSIASYAGSWRRFEKVGEYNTVPVYSDYAHHPTEIKLTLSAIKSFCQSRRLVLVFQPHSFDRTEKLFNEFTGAFADSDVLILTEVYDVAGRDYKKDVTSKKLFDAMHHPDATYVQEMSDAVVTIQRKIKPDDILVFMGAGNIDDVARSFVKKR